MAGTLDLLHVMLMEAFAATRDELPTAVVRCAVLADRTTWSLAHESTEWDDDLVQRALAAIVLLDHLGAQESAEDLLAACTSADPAREARFVNLGLLLRSRRGETHPAPSRFRNLPDEGRGLVRANMFLAERYSPQGARGPGFVSDFTGGAIAQFAMASLVFDHAIYSARLEDARTALTRLGQLAGQITTELGEDHPYLGQVLLTLAAATCALAAVDGNIQDLRRYADVLAIAVQRVSAQLGPDHVHTIGGLANLAHIEFEIALTSRSPDEVAQCRDNLTRLEGHSERVCGAEHPTVIVLAMNAAVAALESARLERSVEGIQGAEARLTRVARRAEERFGLYHPCTAIARSNAAAAGFDVARAERSRPGLEHMVGVLEDTVSQVSESLGAGHATARALTQQLRACRRLLAGDNPWTAGGTSTIVRTVEDEMWGLGDDYVPVYEASSPRPRRRRRRQPDDAASELTIDLFRGELPSDLVEGRVVHVGEDEVLVDVDGTIGVIPRTELSLRRAVVPTQVVKVGDEVELVLLPMWNVDRRRFLSKKRADVIRGWDIIGHLRAANQPIRGTVVEVDDNGLILDLGVLGFMPAEHVERHPVPDLRVYLGRELEATVLGEDRSRDTVILSRRDWLIEIQMRGVFLEHIREGQVYGGVVVELTALGATVDLDGVVGVVPVSELSWKHVAHPSDIVEIGEVVTVEVLDVDVADQRVSLSMRAVQEHPWQRFARTHIVGQIVLGKVTTLVSHGAAVVVAEDVEGLVISSELGDRYRPGSARTVRTGDDLVFMIIDIDPPRRRLSLSLRQANAVSHDTEFDPVMYGMTPEYDDAGNYIYPDGFDPETNEWLPGAERQRAEWEQRYAAARALYERHMRQVTAARPPKAPAKKPPARPALTQREVEIVRMVAQGRTDAAIGESLSLSRQGVFKSLTRIHDKLGLRGRVNLRRYAIEQDLIADSSD